MQYSSWVHWITVGYSSLAHWIHYISPSFTSVYSTPRLSIQLSILYCSTSQQSKDNSTLLYNLLEQYTPQIHTTLHLLSTERGRCRHDLFDNRTLTLLNSINPFRSATTAGLRPCPRDTVRAICPRHKKHVLTGCSVAFLEITYTMEENPEISECSVPREIFCISRHGGHVLSDNLLYHVVITDFKCSAWLSIA